ncbi:sodium-dependent phosphate transporter 1-B-like isoform X1 [Biomphalaria glabrata]|uniref:Phosphate transporter n=1 Tax=Biomphalaria glabrata TaxID=6526 RepID=A0A9W2ZA19_BIOGL|nr:sodium-dependent phosphate transporter 1-B-like isoform X1 [Biomphalaria glabrata]XP_055871741.1 sodium-dependent phosphate transporter 1-B-like isoform X1 [Biomphalaria glabrata]XP_055871742.1 sodium-dependent phosphate transporter 1-B-like isoform X1 [Biomphalaria glabrata]XP_055871743.1 sodium-dependent phosphate transporter 1-B-like isoform X1 [Biomphalaria glabrata]XP_055871744.1 sodium-dependent phosphate transporter 1-B-like isoform X1 [Biomphalaria glabrata]XP_055871746.1 sodium-dep
MSDLTSEWLWIVILAFIISFFLAFGIGANDVANAFGTSVGSKVISLLWACILASIFEVLGAVLIGYRVSDTIRKGIIDPMQYNNSEKLLAMGNLSALTGSCIWMFIATLFRLPVSATHSIVGATVGFSLVAKGTRGVSWEKLGFIVGSWFFSPVMSGIMSALLFLFVRKMVLNKEKPLEPGLTLLPLFYAFTVCINALSVFLDGSELLHFNKIPLYGSFILSIGLALIVGVLVRYLVVPWMRRKIIAEITFQVKAEENKCLEAEDEDADKEERKITRAENKKILDLFSRLRRKRKSITLKEADGECTKSLNENGAALDGERHWNSNGNGVAGRDVQLMLLNTEINETASAGNSTTLLVAKPEVEIVEAEVEVVGSNDRKHLARELIKDKPETKMLFSFLQILTAIFGSFAHGGNDVSNAIGPLIGVWMIYNEGSVAQKAPTPIWILIYGGAGISIGLWVLGRRVIKTMGEDLSKITPSSGFCIEIGAATTVLVASYFALPISTTHCKVGSIIFTGRVRSNENVDWSLFRNIFIAWVVTLPASGALSALMMFLLEQFAL